MLDFAVWTGRVSAFLQRLTHLATPSIIVILDDEPSRIQAMTGCLSNAWLTGTARTEMRQLITTTVWIVSAILCVVASAVVAAGGWLACAPYDHNRSVLDDDSRVAYSIVSVLLVAAGIIVSAASTLCANRRLMGRWFQISLSWLLVSFVFVAAGVAGWLKLLEYWQRIAAEGIVRSMGFGP